MNLSTVRSPQSQLGTVLLKECKYTTDSYQNACGFVSRATQQLDKTDPGQKFIYICPLMVCFELDDTSTSNRQEKGT
jgi:hypothetical protein